MRTLWLIFVNAVILYLSTLIIPDGIISDSFKTTLFAGLIVAGCNFVAFRTILGGLISLILIGLSSIFGSLGIVIMLFVMEVLFLYVVDWILVGFTISGFWWGMLVVLFLVIGNSLFVPSKSSS